MTFSSPVPAEPDCCGSSPPDFFLRPDGSQGRYGDCWCTLADDHEGVCLCELCHTRYGAPGWEAELVS